MHTIVIYSEDNEERILISADLVSDKAININIAETSRSALNTLTNETVRCLIFGAPRFDLDAVKIAGRFRAVNPGVGLLVVTRKSEDSSISAIREMKRTVVLERPFEREDLR